MIFSSIPGERGLPSVGGAASIQSRLSSLLAIGLMSVLGLGMLAWYYSSAITRHASAHQSARDASKARVQGDVPLPGLGPMDLPRAPIAETPRDTTSSLAGNQVADAPATTPSMAATITTAKRGAGIENAALSLEAKGSNETVTRSRLAKANPRRTTAQKARMATLKKRTIQAPSPRPVELSLEQ